MISSTSLPPPTSGKSVTSDGVGETQSVQKSKQINYPSVTLAASILSEEVNIRSENMIENSNPAINSDNQNQTRNIEPVIINPSKSIPKATDIISLEQLPVKQTKIGETKTNLKEKELRQKELRLKKWEEELKQQSATNSQNSNENAKLQAYIMNLEAKIKELENSNRILRIKVAGNVDSAPTNVTNRDLPIPDMPKRHTEHIVEGFPMHIETQHLQSKIQSMENIYNLNRRVSDLEFNSLKQRLDALEVSKQHWPSHQSTGNHQYHGYQNFNPGQRMNEYQSHIPNPHVNGYQNYTPAPQANGYQNHVPGLQVNGYQNHISNPNSNGYQNYVHVPGPYGNGHHNHIPRPNADTSNNSNKIPYSPSYGYHNLKPGMHMGNGQLTPNVLINESHQQGQLPQMLSTPHMHNHNSKTYPWNLPPPCYMKTQPKSAAQSDLEIRHEQITPTMEFNKSSMKNLVTGSPLQISCILSNNPPIDPQPLNDAGHSSVVTQDLDYTTVEIEDKIIHHDQITSEDSENSQGLRLVSDQPVVSTPPMTPVADKEPLLVTGNDNQEEHFLGVTKPQKDLG
ncbi:unnamed protein product [Mytilus edulis]|uniref:Uncharacterized protein n=1 Tax=Mytilus edulis TaxID=6550 RepID=A0A8S3PNP1_MYTED|nr:unnamed protein product [Mytilus edulis]